MKFRKKGGVRFAMSTVVVLLVGLVVSTVQGIRCPTECSCNDDTYAVHCEKSKLNIIPITLNPAIQRLVLRSNKIETVYAAFPFYRDLQYVDLYNNHLVNIANKSFIHQEKLLVLLLNKNKLSSINNTTFVGLKSLTVLNLRENFLSALPRGVFSMLSKLEELNLGQNTISYIDERAFDGLSSLRILYLDDNMLNAVPTLSLNILTNLAELHIGLNSFSNISDYAFESLKRLSLLDVSKVAALVITENAFKGLTSLRSINLVGNSLKTIPSKQLSHLTRLEELYIGQNDFSLIEANSFKKLVNLRKIDVTSAINLERIEKDAFNFNIETIILENNEKLESMEEGALVGLPKLHHLILKGNNFKTFSETWVAWNELKTLDLSKNPIACNCQLLWLAILAQNKNVSTIQCASPKTLKNKQLRTLGANDLGCSFGDPKQKAILVTLCVSAIVLLGGLGLLLFRYRQGVREAVKDYKWNKRAISRKEHEYQKTFSDDEYIIRSGSTTGTNNLHHNHQQNNKPIPVTEL